MNIAQVKKNKATCGTAKAQDRLKLIPHLVLNDDRLKEEAGR